MKKIPFRIIGNMFASLTMMVIVGLFILLAVKSLPTSKESNAIYPDPIEIQTTSPSSSAETLCDQWFAYRRELPEDKRAIAEEEYENCVSARTTPSPVGAIKPIPSAPSVGENNSSIYKRIAGSGTLLESSFSRLNSVYRISNQWFADINGNHIVVYAGGKQSETASGDALLNDLSWPGIIVVSVTDAKGNNLPERGGMFWTPQNGGPVRIVDAADTTLTVVAKSGLSFLFDVVGLRFLSAQPGPTISRSIGAGTLVESEISPYLVEGYEFVNYWYYDKTRL